MLQAIRLFALSALSAALLATAAGAESLPLELRADAAELGAERIFAYGDGVIVTRRNSVEYIDAATLAVTPIDALPSGRSLVPFPIGSRDRFFYATFPGEQLVGLRGLQKTVIAPQVNLDAAAGFGGGHLLFATSNPSRDIFASDGSLAGTGPVLSLEPEAASCGGSCLAGLALPRWIEVGASGRIYYMTSISNVFYGTHPFLVSWDPPAGFPGRPPAPLPVQPTAGLDLYPYVPAAHLKLADGRLFFTVEEPGYQAILFATDGRALGDPIRFYVVESEQPLHDLVELGGLLYFIVEFRNGRELWRSDGTVPGTVRVRAFGPGPRIAALWKHGERLYLPVDQEGHGEELYVSDGTADGTRPAFEIAPGAASSRPRSFTPLDDGRFLIALDDGIHGHEPWISDGTREGTSLLADARPGPLGSSPTDLVPAAGRLFFVGDTEGGRRAQVVDAPLSAPCPAEKLCLRDGRFEVEATFTVGGQSGAAQRSGASSNDAGLFTFFSPGNWELMVKVLDGCNLNGRFWVFAAAATDVRFEIRVKDLESGQLKVYPFAGGPAPALADIEAFSTCPAN